MVAEETASTVASCLTAGFGPVVGDESLVAEETESTVVSGPIAGFTLVEVTESGCDFNSNSCFSVRLSILDLLVLYKFPEIKPVANTVIISKIIKMARIKKTCQATTRTDVYETGT